MNYFLLLLGLLEFILIFAFAFEKRLRFRVEIVNKCNKIYCRVEQLIARRAHIRRLTDARSRHYIEIIDKCNKIYCGVEQLVARRAHNPKVARSSRVPATNSVGSSQLAVLIAY